MTRLDASDWPLSAPCLLNGQAVLAVITAIEGASYRPLGAAMAIAPDGRCFGSLSSGCIEQDVVHHAQQAQHNASGPVVLRYGKGSPFMDLQLPCGGGLEVTLIPNPDPTLLAQIRADLEDRRETNLTIAPTGLGRAGPGLALTLLPPLRMLVFGKGPEPITFAAMARASGHQVMLFSHDDETRAQVPGAHALGRGWPAQLRVDARCAVAMFFHDHDREPELLQAALQTPAFYIGAQGSARARETRLQSLRDLQVPQAALARLAHPFGLIPSVRNPQALAVSVLADILDKARG
ncbi:XdhC family protein [Thioclava sp. SK-1]|uniref:XdhC family protein n=1 Tax=Thioclava sp. SK-1 TaxID=1889770 RepID=UPI00159F06FC|nr:XdhC family protein [Thioclava sp. SK-1]